MRKLKKIKTLIKKIDFDISFLTIYILLYLIFYIYSSLLYKTDIGLIFNFKNIIAVYGIVGTILSSLFIFIMAEGLRDKEERYKIKIFFKESKLITIIILFLFSLILLVLKKNDIVLISLLFFIFCSVYAIYKIASITLNSQELWIKHIVLFRDRVKEVTRFSENIKKKSQKLHKFLDEKPDIFQHFMREVSESVSLKSLKEGTITSMDITLLNKIFKKFSRKTKEIQIKKDKEKIQKESIHQDHILQKRESQDKKEKISLNIDIGEKINLETLLLSYPKEVDLTEKEYQTFEDELNQSIIVEKVTVSDEVEKELEDYRNMIQKSIKEKNISFFDKYFELYYELSEEFITEEAKSYPEDKEGFIPAVNSSWLPLYWIRDPMLDFFNQVINESSKNNFEKENLEKIQEKIKWFSYHLIYLSLKKNHYLLFQLGFQLWLRQLYILSDNYSDSRERIKEHLIFFRERLVFDVFRFIIKERKIKEGKESYAIDLLKMSQNIFQWILKKDKTHEFLNEFNNITKAIINKGSHRVSNNLRDDIDKEKVFNKLSSYDSRKIQFLFGFGAFLEILSKDSSENSFEEIKEFIKDKLLSYFRYDLKSYLNTLTLMERNEVDNYWLWSFIDSPKDGGWRQRTPVIKKYFLKLMFYIHKDLFEDLDIAKITPKTLSTLEFLNTGIDQELQVFQNIDDDSKEKVKTLLQNIAKYQNKKRKKYLIKGEMEPDKVIEFISTFEKRFIKQANMRTLLKNKSIISNIKDDFVWTINMVDFKSPFMSHTEESKDMKLSLNVPINFSGGMIESYADASSESENKFIQNDFLKKCIVKAVSFEGLKENLKNKEWKGNEILLFNDNIYYKLMMDSYFDKSIKRPSPNEEGQKFFNFKGKEIQFDLIYFYEQDIGAMILDSSKLPKLELFNPIRLEKEHFSFEFLENIGVSIGIDAFSSNKRLMTAMINDPPDWLIKKGNKKIQEEYLKQMVNIKISQGIFLNWEDIEQCGTAFIIRN